jgi:hypothetical protein
MSVLNLLIRIIGLIGGLGIVVGLGVIVYVVIEIVSFLIGSDDDDDDDGTNCIDNLAFPSVYSSSIAIVSVNR